MKGLNLDYKTPTAASVKSVQERINLIRKRGQIQSTRLTISQEQIIDTEPKVTEEEDYHQIEPIANPSLEEVKSPTQERPQPRRVRHREKFSPKIDSKPKSFQNVRQNEATKYELVLKEMIEIENQLSFNKILVHYNLLEDWSNRVTTEFQAKEEEFRVQKYYNKRLSPKIEEIINTIKPNKAEVFALSLK